MIINFRQGIVKYPTSAGVQQFLVRNGSNVTLNVYDHQRVDISFASGAQNYLYSEINAIPSAWTNVPNAVDVWLYWDLNIRSGLRTFGFTLLQPTYGTIRPSSPSEDQHWFDTASYNMYVYTAAGGWIRKIRAFAAKLNTSSFTALGADQLMPYAGTQVGIFGNPVDTSYITYDINGSPIIRSNGEFLTLNTELFARGSSVNQVKLEANVIQLIAAEPISRYSVVKLTSFDTIGLSQYDDLTTSVVGIVLDDLEPDELGLVVMQGVVSNPTWNWPTVGAYLWAHNGQLTEQDMHTVDVLTYPMGEPPIARVLSPTSILVTQINESLSDRIGRTITGTPNQIVVVNGDGVAGDPVISLADSVNLTGIPTAPTAAPGTATAQLATTAFVAAMAPPVTSVAGKVGDVALVVGDISGAAPLASPTLTGIPAAPTATPGTATTQLATTAFVANALTSIVQGVEIQDEGVAIATPATSINFVGGSVTATDTGGAVTVDISGGIEVLDEGISISAVATSLDFVGTGVSVTNVGGAITVDVSGGGGGGSLSILNDTTTDATFYPVFSSATTGTLSTANVSSYKLQYVPYTGKLYATEINTSSDLRLKHGIVDLPTPLETTLKLRGVEFSWNHTDDTSYGVIAQEVEAVVPELVSVTAEGYKSVNYQALTAFLIESIRELNDRIAKLENSR